MRTAIARALPMLLLLTIPVVSGCQTEAKKHLYKAEDLFEKRDLDGAKKELELSLKADPNDLDAHKSLAHIDEALVPDLRRRFHEHGHVEGLRIEI